MLFRVTGTLRPLRHAPPCILVWAVYLLAYWPALMSPDSIAQWDQVTKTSFSNNYPAFHTLTQWLITRIWLSPAAISMAQIVMLAAVFSLVVDELGRWGVSRRVCAWVTAAFSLSPVNGMLVITLWKDIPFTCATLGLVLVLLRAARTEGRWLQTPSGMFSLWLAVTLMSLFRHNGVPMVGLLLMILLIVWRKVCFKSLVRVGINWLLVFFIITGPIYRLLGVAPMARFFAMQNILHQLGAMIAHSAIRSKSELAVLAQVQPIESWIKHYHCYSLNPLLYNEHFQHHKVESIAAPLLTVWQRALWRNPEILIAHQQCVTALLWQVSEPHSREGRLYITESGIVPNDLGLKTQSLWPRARTIIANVVEKSSRPDWTWLLWRPALYFYALLLCLLIGAIRSEKPLLLLVGLPAVLNTGVWLALITTQDLRFQYPVYAVALIAPALLFVPRHKKIDRHPGGQ